MVSKGKVRNVHYLKPDRDWTKPDGWLVERYYFTDFLHLVEEGYGSLPIPFMKLL